MAIDSTRAGCLTAGLANTGLPYLIHAMDGKDFLRDHSCGGNDHDIAIEVSYCKI